MTKAEIKTTPNRVPSSAAATVVKPVRNAVRILQLLSSSHEALTLTQIVRMLELNSSTCHGILRTLVSDGLLAFEVGSKTYSLGDALLTIADPLLVRYGAQTVLRPAMEDIAQRYAVTTSLWRVIEEDRIRLESSVPGSGNIRIQMRPGQRLPRWIAAVGRVMAAYSGLDRQELRRRFTQIRWQTPISFRDYYEQVQHVHERGWAIDDGNYAKGVLSICVPVFERGPKLTMACSATMFAGQLGKPALAKLAADMQKVSRLLAPLAPPSIDQA